jgi:hypothetical protein
MEMLNNSFVDTDCPPFAPFRGNDSENLRGETEVETDDEEMDADCEMEEVTKVEMGKVKTRKKRAMNYMEVEDTTLCHVMWHLPCMIVLTMLSLVMLLLILLR